MINSSLLYIKKKQYKFHLSQSIMFQSDRNSLLLHSIFQKRITSIIELLNATFINAWAIDARITYQKTGTPCR